MPFSTAHKVLLQYANVLFYEEWQGGFLTSISILENNKNILKTIASFNLRAWNFSSNFWSFGRATSRCGPPITSSEHRDLDVVSIPEPSHDNQLLVKVFIKSNVYTRIHNVMCKIGGR